MTNRTKWKLLAGATTLAASLATRSLLTRAASDDAHPTPTDDPELEETGVVKAVAWSLALAGAAGLARLAAHRATAGVWRWVTSAAPPSRV